MVVEQVQQVETGLVAAINALLPQLSSSAAPLTDADLDAIVSSDATCLLIAKDNDTVCGMLTLAIFPIPTGTRAWIEDVVVNEAARAMGVGSALVRAAVELARAKKARTVDLTSHPDRQAANRLYRRLGFSERLTNVYRMAL